VSEENKFEELRDLGESSSDNWYEVRLVGKVPERRGYHSYFVHKEK